MLYCYKDCNRFPIFGAIWIIYLASYLNNLDTFVLLPLGWVKNVPAPKHAASRPFTISAQLWSSLHFLATLVAASTLGGAAEVARVRVWLVGSRGRESRWVGDQLEHNAVYVVGSGSFALFRTFPFYFSFSPHPIGTRSTHRLFAGLFVFSLPPAPGSQWHRHGRASRCCGVASWLARGSR